MLQCTHLAAYILSAAWELTRLDLVTEAVRAALEEFARTVPDLLDEVVTAEWGERYGRPGTHVQPARPSLGSGCSPDSITTAGGRLRAGR